MRTILFFLLAGLIAVNVSAQSAVVTSKKTIYTRPNPTSDYKKTFTITYPKIKASTPALSRRIESVISYQSIFNLDVEEEINDVQWLEEADFIVVYNTRGLLCIDLFISGSGAYPSGTTKTVIVNLKNGNRIKASDAFADHNGLAALVKEKFIAEIGERIKELKADPENRDEDPAQLFENKDFTAADLEEFSIDEKGVTFIYDYGFPHVIKAYEPDGRFHFTWKEVSRHIKPDGPFAQFIVR